MGILSDIVGNKKELWEANLFVNLCPLEIEYAFKKSGTIRFSIRVIKSTSTSGIIIPKRFQTSRRGNPPFYISFYSTLLRFTQLYFSL